LQDGCCANDPDTPPALDEAPELTAGRARGKRARPHGAPAARKQRARRNSGATGDSLRALQQRPPPVNKRLDALLSSWATRLDGAAGAGGCATARAFALSLFTRAADAASLAASDEPPSPAACATAASPSASSPRCATPPPPQRGLDEAGTASLAASFWCVLLFRCACAAALRRRQDSATTEARA
jgi:hypothetical protein